MIVAARPASRSDLDLLEHLYRMLEKEMTELHEMWPVADGLAEPVRDSLVAVLDDPERVVLVGEVDGFPFGFLVASVEDLLPQAGGEQVGAIRFVFVDPEAREVGVGEAMREEALGILRRRGIRRFDAHVLPGHRLVKNFFEAGGFSARSIVMHHVDDPEPEAGAGGR